jgi:FMN phosphatase YigB (HAD superfamily)
MASPVLFFDIGNTLAVPRLKDGALVGLEVFPFVPEILSQLREHCRLGILSNTGDETLDTMNRVLSESGIAQYFDKVLQLFSSVEGIDKTQVEFFERAVKRSATVASRCVYVSEDDAERATARKAGMQVSYHALHVFHVIDSMRREE